jgi:hypothetical protein
MSAQTCAVPAKEAFDRLYDLPSPAVQQLCRGDNDGARANAETEAHLLSPPGPSLGGHGRDGVVVRLGHPFSDAEGKRCRGRAVFRRFQRRCSRPATTATISTPGPRADPRACKTSSLPARGATEPKAPGFLRQPSRKDWNDDGGTTSLPMAPLASANSSRSAKPLSPTTAASSPPRTETERKDQDGQLQEKPCPDGVPSAVIKREGGKPTRYLEGTQTRAHTLGQ